jgi:hypothetical protein
MNGLRLLCVVALSILLPALPASATNILVNGDFEASTDPTTTPPGWTNVGHSDGVIAYSMFSTPDYNGSSYFYDLGGFGDANGPVGDGIEQTVGTIIGRTYVLTFGLSSEDVSGDSTLRVLIGSDFTDYDLTSNGTFLGKGFTTQSIIYTATAASTTISFIEWANTSAGNNDPMIDGVSFDDGFRSVVPEPATWMLSLLGFAGLALTRRRSSFRRAVI